MKGRFVALAVLALGGGGRLEAQSIAVEAARWLTTPHVTDYRLSVGRRWIGPIAVAPNLTVVVQGPRADRAFLIGVGGDLLVPLSRDARPYLVGGAGVGFLDLEASVGVSTWSTWSAGAGAELLRLGPIGLGIEARWQHLSRRGTEGVSLGIRLGSAIGRRGGARSTERPAPEPSPPAPPALATIGGAAAASRAAEVARGVMGTPYQWGGSDQNGFDCSGLIQYAYRQVGIDLPRRSQDQARVGQEVERSVAALLPGDILIFTDKPGGERVTHVGLYLGDGKFIHSASAGVRVSTLSDGDPDGRWWFARWIGVRRV